MVLLLDCCVEVGVVGPVDHETVSRLPPTDQSRPPYPTTRAARLGGIMPSVPTPTKSGIVEQGGERHIPSSTRSDGSLRKEIKIRPGYKPPEDVEVYQNRTANAFRTKGTGGVPGAEGLRDSGDSSAANNKNAKRREARKKAKAGEGDSSKPEVKEEPVMEMVDPEVEREKKARNLKKKLKQAKELKEKKDEGGALLPEQFAKVIKINELIRELDALGFDAEGEPKDKKEGSSKA